MSLDPFTASYRTLADVIKDSAPLAAIVAADNIVVFDDERPPNLDYRQYGDLPCVFLRPAVGGSRDDVWHTSSSMSAQIACEFEVWTGDERLSEYLWPIRWALAKTLKAATNTLSGTYIVNSDFAGPWTPLDPAEAPNDELAERGWGARVTILLELRIPHTTLDA